MLSWKSCKLLEIGAAAFSKKVCGRRIQGVLISP